MKNSLTLSRVLWISFVLLTPGVIIYKAFSKIFACPSCYLFEDGGDGLKNYYTLDYYVRHDSGWHFSGMNYPYGEHIIYTDNQPALAMFLGWIHRHVVNMDHHVIGTLNMLLLISIYLGVIVCYILLKRWQVGRWWAFAASLCIVFMSPQLLRLHGHYGLGYIFFLPLLYLLLDNMIRQPKRRWIWAIASGVLVILMSLTHMYFLLLSALMISAVFGFWWIYHRKDKPEVKRLLPLFLAAIVLPGLFLVGLRKYTDTVNDRPIEPWGIDNHTITFETTFFSFTPPFDKAWTEILSLQKPITERVAYVGIVGLLMLPAIVYFLIRKRDETLLNKHVKIFLWAGVIAWFMASGFIYQNGFKFLWEAVPVLKQFRGLGRFGIPFYYIYLLVCSYLLWQIYKALREREQGSVGVYLLSAVFLVWGFEAWINLRVIRDPVFRVNKWLSFKKDDYVPLLNNAGYPPETFQAILQFPLVAIGNETMGVTRGFWTLREGVHASTETGLPLIDYAMSRTSVSQGLDIVELISTPYTEKRRGKLLNDKPILLLCEEEFVIPAERKWIEKATKIGQYQSITLYSLPASVFKTITLPVIDSTMYHCEGWFNGFEDHPCDTVMTGSGALPVLTAPFSIWSFSDTNAVERHWIVSFWTHVDNIKGHVAVPRMMETGPDGTVLRNSGLHRESILWSEAYGNWIEITFPWNTLGKGYRYELFLDMPGSVIDNLLIRPAQDTCIHTFPDMTLYNNLPIPVHQ
jgi:hypothetical protein